MKVVHLVHKSLLFIVQNIDIMVLSTLFVYEHSWFFKGQNITVKLPIKKKLIFTEALLSELQHTTEVLKRAKTSDQQPSDTQDIEPVYQEQTRRLVYM